MTLSSRLIGAGKALARSGFEQLWATIFGIGGAIQRPDVREWCSPGGQRILVIAPHPDDEAIGCAGTLLRHKRCGDSISVIYVTDGGQSRALGLDRPTMVQRRKDEATQAARLLDVDQLEWLGLPEGDWIPAKLKSRLEAIIKGWAPQIIYAPSLIDFHPQHWLVAQTLAQALSFSLADDAVLRIYQVQVPLTALLVNLVTPIASVGSAQRAVCAAYVTQRDSIARTARMRRYAAQFYGCAGEVEEFWELSAAQYCRLHSSPIAGWRPLRSLRSRPVRDLLAYLQSRSERRRLRRVSVSPSNR